jgi:hypothetical protein
MDFVDGLDAATAGYWGDCHLEQANPAATDPDLHLLGVLVGILAVARLG